MKHIFVDNVNQALVEGFWHLKLAGHVETSRNGNVIVSPGPVLTEYRKPWQRVLFNPVRDANPTFHLMEAVWMLAGRCDLAFLEPFNSRFGQFAEEDGIVWGAYGHRWRNCFSRDQIYGIIDMLRTDPDSRRAVMQMWHTDLDLGADKRDIPCNTHIYFDCRGNVLNMTVCCRSNDILWGAYGANAVHMSVLQELIAAGVGIPMGVYRQFSNNYHAYLGAPNVERFLDAGTDSFNRYQTNAAICLPLLGVGERFEESLEDAQTLCEGEDTFKTRFFQVIAEPLAYAYLKRSKDKSLRLNTNYDWHMAYNEWADRRDANDVG